VILGGLAAGMTMSEVKEKQESIIEFADIGGFIDLPTTTYSSGMFGRLAFAVATHVDPEILLIDEALSAGDAAFRDKAVAKVKDMCKAAQTIIVVSHSSSMVSEMAEEAIWLHQGRIRQEGKADEVTAAYETFQKESKETAQMDRSIAGR
jgi:ABC-2 type transport system ATP-binding protein/teichoic acid transport system ATP-binding protein